MSNPWFTKPSAIIDGTLANAADVNDLSNAVEAAFDALDADVASTYAKHALGNISGAVVFDLSLGNYFTATVTGNVTSVSITNETAGADVAQGFVIELNNGGAFSITWTGIKWSGGAAPVLTVAGKDILAFLTSNTGTDWHGSASSLDTK